MKVAESSSDESSLESLDSPVPKCKKKKEKRRAAAKERKQSSSALKHQMVNVDLSQLVELVK